MTSPDSLWSCVVCFGLFITTINTLGLSYSLGIYFTSFKEEFATSSGLTSLISALNYGLLCGLGPLAGVLVTKFGCRLTLAIAGALSSFGLGVGFGLSFTTCVIAISQHFSKFRNMALGMYGASGGFGMVLYPYLTTFLTETYGWRGAILISSAIQLHAFPAALLAKEPEDLNTDERKEKAETLEFSGFFDTINELASFKYVVFLFSCVFMVAGHLIVTTHLAAFVMSLGFTQDFADLLISAMGLGGIIGRIFLSSLAQAEILEVPTIFISSQCISGLCVLAVAFIRSYYGILICILIFGIFISATGPTLIEMTYILTRVDLFPISCGFSMLACGIGGVIGPPTAGFVFDATDFYPTSFYLGFSALLFSASVSLTNEKCSKSSYNLSREDSNMKPTTYCARLSI